MHLKYLKENLLKPFSEYFQNKKLIKYLKSMFYAVGIYFGKSDINPFENMKNKISNIIYLSVLFLLIIEIR